MEQSIRNTWSILYIDDDEDDFILLRDLLSTAKGHTIILTWARSYKEGEDRLSADQYDAVLVDYDLGARTGIELIRAFSPHYPSPFILYTGRGSYEIDLEAMQAGASLYLTKAEFNALTLERLIRYAIERKQAEITSRLNERKFSLLFEKAVYPITLTRFPSGEIVDANQAFLDLFGFSRQEVLGNTILDLKINPDAEIRRQIIAQLEAAGSMRDLEMTLLTRAGEPRRVSVNFDLLEIDGLSYVLNLTRDVTEHRRAEEALLLAHQQAVWTARFPDENPNPVARVALAGTVLYCNRASMEPGGWEFETGRQVSPHFLPLLEEAWRSQAQLDRDLQIGERFYSITFMPFREDNYINLYGREITTRVQAERALSAASAQLIESENRFRIMADGTPDLIWVTDREGQLEFANRAYLDFFGVTLEKVRSEGWQMLIHPDDTDTYVDPFFKAFEERRQFRAQGRALRSDGQWRWLDSHGQPRISETGEYLGMAGSSLDITEQKQAQADLAVTAKDLANERNRLLAIFQAMPIGMAILDEKGGVEAANRFYQTIWGETIPETNSVDDYAAFQAWFVETGKPVQPEEWASAVALQKGMAVTDQFLEIQRFDGSHAFVLNSAAPTFDSSGQITGSVVAIMDVSRLVETEAALNASQDRLRVALQSVPLMVYTCDLDLRYTSIYQPLRSFRAEDVLGRRDDEILTPQAAAELTAAKQKALDTGLGSIQEVTVPIQDEPTYYILTTDPIRNRKGQITGLTCSAIDITEQKRLEKEQQEQAIQIEVQHRLLEQRELERTTFARELHDGPIQSLSSILFHLQTIRSEFPDEGLEREFDSIREEIKASVRELRSLMNDLRPPSLLHFGLSRVLQVQAEEYRARYPQIEINLDMIDDRDALDEQARLALFRICQAGVSNILRHSDASKVWVTFNVDAGDFCLELRDNGVGFKPFTDFSQLTNDGRFGLVGMKERAEAIGARLLVLTEPAHGTTIRVEGPVRGKAD